MGRESTVKKFIPGECIFQEGQGCDAFYVIKKGQVEVAKRNKGGGMVPIALLNSGEFLGEVSLVRGTAHTSTATALTEVEVAVISKKQFESQLLKTPSWIVAMLNQMTNRLQKTNETLKSSGFVDTKLQSSLEAFGRHRNAQMDTMAKVDASEIENVDADSESPQDINFEEEKEAA